MTPIDAFLLTIAVGAGGMVTFASYRAVETVFTHANELLKSAVGALKRYACRDMIVRAYYEPEHMRHVKEWQEPTPYHVEAAKKGAWK
jgi:hypothetical protein